MEYIKKYGQLKQMSDYRNQLRQQPILKFLFLELTMNCNERCLHCGSSCGDVRSEEIPVQTYFKLLDTVKKDFDPLPMLCVTGGEPLLRK